MEFEQRLRENWLTRKPHQQAGVFTALYAWLLFTACFAFFGDVNDSNNWMPASGAEVFGQHEYWRAWTALFAHADLGHLLSNAILFIPTIYLIASHFSPIFLPLLGLALGGVTNLIVLRTMPAEATLVGISGVVFWLGGLWLTLFLLVDRRERLRRRLGSALFLALILFVPDTIRPEVSYLSHFVGFVSGVLSGLAYYFFHRTKFRAAELYEIIYPEPLEEEPEALANN